MCVTFYRYNRFRFGMHRIEVILRVLPVCNSPSQEVPIPLSSTSPIATVRILPHSPLMHSLFPHSASPQLSLLELFMCRGGLTEVELVTY